MIKINDKQTLTIYRGKKKIQSLYIGKTLVYSSGSMSCYANGYWMDEYPWTDKDLWADKT